ncbi:hypothetical protein ABGB12_22845 [Actinocorallia sp. B10E7]|uniref:hypothetical protein n=1 Tax=Actinocorallia sp. B10E7 TaxID=3153558 RepID=UPI00325C785E
MKSRDHHDSHDEESDVEEAADAGPEKGHGPVFRPEATLAVEPLPGRPDAGCAADCPCPGEDRAQPPRGEAAPGDGAPRVLNHHIDVAQALIGSVLVAAGHLLNARLADGAEEGIRAWLVDQDDLRNIATPLARIATRQAPLPQGEGSASDATDLLMAGAGALAYLVKNLNRAAVRRAPVPRPRAAGDDEPPTGDLH